MKFEDSPLQILVLMRALGLARGQGSADQFTSFAVGNWWMTTTSAVLGALSLVHVKKSHRLYT